MTFDVDDHAGHTVITTTSSETKVDKTAEGLNVPRQTIQWVRYCTDCGEVVK